MRARVAAILSFVCLVAGCFAPDVPAPPTTTTPTAPTSPASPAALAFDGERALALAREQVLRADGTVRHRVPGTEGNAEAAAIIASHLADAGLDVRYHHFNATYDCRETAMHNVVGTIPGAAGAGTLYLGAHYDSRPIAEKDPDHERRDEPIPGANDGGSGVGALLELARVAADARATNVTLVFLFFDGEDGGNVGGEDCTDWILGSTAFAAALTEEQARDAHGMVLLDMVGDADLRLPREGRSAAPQNRALGDRIWAVAGGLGYEEVFLNETSYAILDDHVPFIERGIPAVDIIDLREGKGVFAPTHHTHADDVERLSADALGMVGRTLEQFVRELDAFAAGPGAR